MGKRICAAALVVVMLVSFCGCSQMPFNGDVTFHGISLTIPERFIRDSAQSTDDFWVFEYKNYSEYILVSRKDMTADAPTIESYAEAMKANGAESAVVPFLNRDAVISEYYLENVFCQELLLSYENSFYAVALRGGTQSGFEEITATIKLQNYQKAAA